MNNPTTSPSAQKIPASAPFSTHNPAGDMQPAQDAIDYLKAYARERPEVAALWCFGIGFVLGWKLKPW